MGLWENVLGGETHNYVVCREKMALEDEYGSCAADDQNFNMTHTALYGLHGVILVLELVVGLGLIAVGCILYRKHLAPVPFAVPSAGSRQVRSSSADGSLSTHDHRPSEGTAHSEGHRLLAASSFNSLFIPRNILLL